MQFVQCSFPLHQFVFANDASEIVGNCHQPVIFWHFTDCCDVPSETWLGLYRAVQFRVSPTLYLLLYAHPHLHLSPPPHSPHVSLLLSLHHAPSLPHFLPAFSRCLNIRLPSLAIVSRRTFYMLTVSLFLFPIVNSPPYLIIRWNCTVALTLSALAFLLFLFSPVHLV